MKDYYKILQINKEASPEIITKVYRILAKKYHPDSKPENLEEAEEKFKEISEAYEILSNEEKRKKYDAELEEEQVSNNSSVSVDDYNLLLQHCEELEAYIAAQKNNYNTNSSSQENYNRNNAYQNNNNQYTSTSSSYSANNNYYNQAKAQAESKAYQDAINKAYHDSYINSLKNLGYKIRYKQTFKQKLKNLLALIITFTLVFAIAYILWHVPACQEKIKDMFTITIKNSGF